MTGLRALALAQEGSPIDLASAMCKESFGTMTDVAKCPRCARPLPATQLDSADVVLCLDYGLIRETGEPMQPHPRAIRWEMGNIALHLTYLWEKGGLEAVGDYADWWARHAARDRAPVLAPLPPRMLGLFERDFEHWWIGRECESLTSDVYVGVVSRCPLLDQLSRVSRDSAMPTESIHRTFSVIIYEGTYRLLGHRSQYVVNDDGSTRLTLHLQREGASNRVGVG